MHRVCAKILYNVIHTSQLWGRTVSILLEAMIYIRGGVRADKTTSSSRIASKTCYSTWYKVRSANFWCLGAQFFKVQWRPRNGGPRTWALLMSE